MKYLPYSNELYFFLAFYVSNQTEQQVGFLAEHGRTLHIHKQDMLPNQCEHTEDINRAIGRALSRKAMFGWS